MTAADRVHAVGGGVDPPDVLRRTRVRVMKPRRPLERKTPMPRQSTPLRRTPIKSATARVREVQSKPQRRRVSPEERRARVLVKARSGGTCELWMCGGAPATDWSHRVRNGKGGAWSAVNGLHSCRECHSTITTHPWDCDAERKGWAIRSWQDPAETPALRRGEWVWLLADGGYEPVEPEFLARWLRGAA